MADNYKSQYESEKTLRQTREKTLVKLKNVLLEMKSQNETLTKQNEILEQEKQALAEQLEQVAEETQPNRGGPDPDKLQSEIRSLRAELKLATKRAAADSDLQDLRKQFEGLKVAYTGATAKLEQSERTRKNLSDELETLKRDSRNKITALKKRIDGFDAAQTEKDGDLTEAQNARAMLEKNVVSLKSQLVALKTQGDALDGAGTLTEELEKAQEETERLQKLVLELQRQVRSGAGSPEIGMPSLPALTPVQSARMTGRGTPTGTPGATARSRTARTLEDGASTGRRSRTNLTARSGARSARSQLDDDLSAGSPNDDDMNGGHTGRSSRSRLDLDDEGSEGDMSRRSARGRRSNRGARPAASTRISPAAEEEIARLREDLEAAQEMARSATERRQKVEYELRVARGEGVQETDDQRLGVKAGDVPAWDDDDLGGRLAIVEEDLRVQRDIAFTEAQRAATLEARLTEISGGAGEKSVKTAAEKEAKLSKMLAELALVKDKLVQERAARSKERQTLDARVKALQKQLDEAGKPSNSNGAAKDTAIKQRMLDKAEQHNSLKAITKQKKEIDDLKAEVSQLKVQLLAKGDDVVLGGQDSTVAFGGGAPGKDKDTLQISSKLMAERKKRQELEQQVSDLNLQIKAETKAKGEASQHVEDLRGKIVKLKEVIQMRNKEIKDLRAGVGAATPAGGYYDGGYDSTIATPFYNGIGAGGPGAYGYYTGGEVYPIGDPSTGGVLPPIR